MRTGVVAGVLLAAALVAACGEWSPAVSSDRPDIVLVVIDTLRADHVGVYGHTRPTTPHLDSLAREGVWFARAHAHSGWTLPAFASLLTGLLPHEHRVGRDPYVATRFGRLPDTVETLAERLVAAGYRTGAIVNNTFLAPEFGLHQGFESYDYEGADNDTIRSARESVERALDWIGDGDGRPFFLLLHLMEPHTHYDPPAEVRGAFTGDGPPPIELPFATTAVLDALRRGESTLSPSELDYVSRLYDEEILAADRALGELVRGLGARTRWDETFVVVTSDHGEELLDHGSFEHGHTLYGELTRVPLAARGPGLHGGRSDRLVQHTDVFRSLLARARAVPPPGTRGRDVLVPPLAVDPEEPGIVVENVLYGPPRVALVRRDLALHADPIGGGGQLWRLDARGIEATKLTDETGAAPARELWRSLLAARGTLSPVDTVAGPHIPDEHVLSRLRSLGYLD